MDLRRDGVAQWRQSQLVQMICGMSLCWTVDECRRHVRMRGVRTSV